MIMEQKLCAACVALAVLALVTAVPQGSALAKGGMNIHTADLCRTGNEDGSEVSGIGTVAAVTDKRTRISADPWTAWAVSLEGLHAGWHYGVYNDNDLPEFRTPCGGDSVYEMSVETPDGTAFQNIGSFVNPEVGNTVWICRRNDSGNVGEPFDPSTFNGDLVAILEGVLVKGGKEKNKPNRCR